MNATEEKEKEIFERIEMVRAREDLNGKQKRRRIRDLRHKINRIRGNALRSVML